MIDILGNSISGQDALLFGAVVVVCLVAAVVVRRDRQRRGLPVGLWHGESAGTGLGLMVIGAMILGAAAFVYALPATCEGDVMRPGDYCQSYYRDSGEPAGEPESYASIVRYHQSIGLVVGVFGVVAVASGAWWVGRSLLSRNRIAGHA